MRKKRREFIVNNAVSIIHVKSRNFWSKSLKGYNCYIRQNSQETFHRRTDNSLELQLRHHLNSHTFIHVIPTLTDSAGPLLYTLTFIILQLFSVFMYSDWMKSIDHIDLHMYIYVHGHIILCVKFNVLFL